MEYVRYKKRALLAPATGAAWMLNGGFAAMGVHLPSVGLHRRLLRDDVGISDNQVEEGATYHCLLLPSVRRFPQHVDAFKLQL